MDDIAIVPLTQGKEAIIDARFAADVLAFKWNVQKKKHLRYGGRLSSVLDSTGKRKAKMILLHRFIYELAYGPIAPGMLIDHKNGNGLDNRLENLRVVTKRQNNTNQQIHRNGRLLGAAWKQRERMWQSHLNVNGKRIYLGRFETEQEAHQAYLEAVKRYELE